MNAAPPARSAANTQPAMQNLEKPEGVAAARLLLGRASGAVTLPEQIAAEVGERIGEDQLARSFHVSRGPIRDALKILEREGLVTITSRKGAVASTLTAADLQELSDVRAGLFAIALRGFAKRATPEVLAQYNAHLDTVAGVTNDDRLALVWLEAIDRLVLFIAYHCGNARAARILTTLSLQGIRYFRRASVPALNPVARRREVLKFYRDLGAAYAKGGNIEPSLERLQRIVVERVAAGTAALENG